MFFKRSIKINKLLLTFSLCLTAWAVSSYASLKFKDTVFEQYKDLLKPGHIVSLETSIDNIKTLQQRKLFLKAELSLELSHYKNFKQQLSQLNDYPLKPYLVYKNMRRQLGRLSSQSINDFFSQYSTHILGYRLRRDLIRYYERHHRWQDLLSVYTPQNNPRLQCAYLQALIKTDQSILAFPQIQSLWLNAHSQPRNCDSVFNAWSKAGLKTSELIWQRIALAIKAGKIQLARYLGKSLNANDRQWVSLWIKLDRKPLLAINNQQLNQTHPYASKIALHAIKRLSKSAPLEAAELWKTLSSEIFFSQQQSSQVYRLIGLAMAQQHLPNADYWLQKIPDALADNYILEWRIRSSIRSAAWQKTLHYIRALPIKRQASLRWQFWQAYAESQLGNIIEADSRFRDLANRRSYYGFLAADQLNLPYAFENRPLQITDTAISHISQLAGTRRAHELYRLGRILDARREWYQLISKLSSTEKLAASKLAQQWHWHDRAIFTMGQTKYRDDIALRFPLTLQKMIQSWSQKRQIDSAWTYAIIRRESAFMSDAHSPAGAIGLMQLMPSTARQIARQTRIHYRGKKSLLSTETNIKLGTRYLEQMLARNNQQTVLATAAYNAGPRRVDNWLPKHKPMEAIRWIETIPFTETREYVSNVLAYTIIYQHRLGVSHSRLTQKMPLIPARVQLAQR